MPHALVDHPLPGLDDTRLGRLAEAGVDSLESLVAVGAEQLANLTGFDVKTCRALVRVARSALREVPSGVIELVPYYDEPPTARLARGLEAARRIEDVLSVVRKARSRTGKKPHKASWRRHHKRARRQLKRLLGVLGDVQRVVLAEGLSSTALAHLEDQLEPLRTSLQSLLDEGRLRKRHLKRLARVAKRSRKQLGASTL